MAYKIDGFPGREIHIEGESYLYFGGTSYLGLQTDDAFKELFVANVKKYGTNYGASRKSNIQLSVFENTESYLSKIVGSEACTTLSSGYLAGQLVAKQFNTEDYACFYAPNTHCALFSNKTVCFENYADLKLAVQTLLKNDSKRIPVIFLDSIDFSGANYPDFVPLQKLPLDKVILVVDDSHGIGVVGISGGGVFRKVAQLQPKEAIVCCSLGKGFGIQAGSIFGTKKRIYQVTGSEFYGGASPATPAAMATLLQAESIYENKRTLLQENIECFKSLVKERSRFTSMPRHPAFNFSDEILVQKLEQAKIIITSFRYPDEEKELMSRIVISASHKKEDIQLLCSTLNTL